MPIQIVQTDIAKYQITNIRMVLHIMCSPFQVFGIAIFNSICTVEYSEHVATTFLFVVAFIVATRAGFYHWITGNIF